MTANHLPNQESISFQIIVKGSVDESWAKWLGNFSIEPLDDFHAGKMTKFIGKVTDQAALRGLMNQLWDLNLFIISYQQIDPKLIEKEGESYENK